MDYIATFINRHTSGSRPCIPHGYEDKIRTALQRCVQERITTPPRIIPEEIRDEARRALIQQIHVETCRETGQKIKKLKNYVH